jgi:rubrerythrin
MANGYEKDYDDEVYTDEYYEEHFDDEELTDEEELGAEGAEEDDEEEEEEGEDIAEFIDEDDGLADDDPAEKDAERKIDASYACDDCDYRWDDVIIKRKDVLEDYDDEPDVVCPMCGSVNISII